MMMLRRRLSLAHLPTPHPTPARLAEATGIDLWIKRDDMTGGAEAGNKIRKLEFLLADALSHECDTVITCGGLQSNHARATALAARVARPARRALLAGPNDPERRARVPLVGNVLARPARRRRDPPHLARDVPRSRRVMDEARRRAARGRGGGPT